jgi:hypothetical protein
MTDSKDPTHPAFILKRDGRRNGRWLASGTGRLGSDGVFEGFIDSLPIGGFTGHIHFAPIGKELPAIEPQRPDKPDDADEDLG